jgi:predicted SPOUT superfamily RNA methylase MTH1
MSATSPEKSVEELPKIDVSIKAELEADRSLKHVETEEKNVLPSAEQIDQERTQRKLIEGIETFPKQQLKPAQTEEKNTLPSVTQIEQEKTLVS